LPILVTKVCQPPSALTPHSVTSLGHLAISVTDVTFPVTKVNYLA